VENIACRIAERCSGRITPNHIIPYLPVSLGLVRDCLDEMVDGTSVQVETKDNIRQYEFAAYREKPEEKSLLIVPVCVACDKDPVMDMGNLLCSSCMMILRQELNDLAEKTGWPAQAVYEHDILYHASGKSGSVHAEDIAGSSRYTLRSVRKKLNRLTLDHFARQELDSDAGVMKYSFPQIEYPRYQYKKNMETIRSYPASIMEEVQVKVVKILFSLGLMLLCMLLLAFWGMPFPMLVLLFIATGPIMAFKIWRHKDSLEED